MDKRQLGNSDIQISPIIMGTWQAGKAMWSGIDDNETTKAMRAAFDMGITAFDTAEAYGQGHSERILGTALADVRDKVIYASKVYSNHLRYDQVMDACHRSLKNLKTDYIDLYQIHWPSGSFGSKIVPIEETLRAMGDLKDQGKIREIGVSNFSKNQLEEACQYAPIQGLQSPYSLFWRHVEKDAIPFCLDHNITILAYSSMAQGILTGKFGPGHQFPKGDHRSKNRLFRPEYYKYVLNALDKLRPIAERNQASLGQLALAWVLSRPKACAIVGARNAEQIIQSAETMGINFSEGDLQEMDSISHMVTDQLDDSPLLWDF
jgi:myo-inositol catabolism protein IolS